MGKYRVTTDQGTYEVTTDDGASAPPSLMPGTPNSDAAGRFAHGIANTMNPVPGIQAIANDPQGLKHGIEEGIFAPQAEQFHKASDAIHGRGEFGSMGTVGRISSAAGHAAAGSLPLVGPAAANAGDKIGDGDIAGGLGEAAGLGLSAVTPEITKGIGKGMMRAAEPVAESALGIRNVDRAVAKSPGRAALDMTSGFAPGKVAGSASDVIKARVALRDAILAKSKNTVSLRPARAEVAQSIKTAQAGNSIPSDLKVLSEHLTVPHEGFAGSTQYPQGAATPIAVNHPTLPSGAVNPFGKPNVTVAGAPPVPEISELQTPMDALKIRQRFGNDYTKFDHARPLTKEQQAVGNRAYKKITDEIHSAEPESAAPDKDISNLIPVKENARVKSLNAGPVQNAMHRFAAHTGAIAGGAGVGYSVGGIGGAVAGAILPDLISSPEVRMGAARGINAAGKAMKSPITGRIAQGAVTVGNLKHDDPLGLTPYLEDTQ